MIEKLKQQLAQEGKIRFQIKVIPKANHTEIIGTMSDNTIKIRVSAVPENNKANTEIIKYLAKEFKAPKNSIRIVSGQTSPRKTIEIT